jgi:short-subunit dehydrogenase
MNVNVMGVVHGCRYFIPQMLAAGGPRQVLNVASSAGNFPAPSMAAYAASKHAVAGFSEVLKMELAETQIGITTVCPGVINTAIVTTGAGVSPSVPASQIEKLQAYYVAKGCTPEVVAEDMVRAVQQGQDICLTGPGAALVYHLKRLSIKLVRMATVYSAKKMGYL